MVYETIIIGAGMAGLTAAMYASRKRMAYEIISSDFGGQFMVSGEILNYPGIVKTKGSALSIVMKKQMDFNGVKIKSETVKSIEKKGKNFVVMTNKKAYETMTVIVATGSKPKKLGVTGEDQFANRGLSYCAVCDGPLFAGKEVAVIGGGDSAMEAVDFMKNIASKIYLLVLGEKLKGHEYLQEAVKKNPQVEILFKAQTTEVLGNKFVSGIKYQQEGKEKKLSVKGIFVEVGRIPSTGPFKKLVKLDEHGHILINGQSGTSVPGIFAAGDCASGHEYQYAIAAGQGCMALLKAARYLARGN